MSSSKNDAPSFIDYAQLVLLAAIWGGSFALIKVAIETITPVTMTTLRLIVAALFLIVVAAGSGQQLPRSARVWGLMAMAAIFGNALPFVLISWGEKTVDSGLAAILMAIMPLTTLLLAHIFTDDEKLNRWKLAGVILGVAGLIVLMGPKHLASLGGDVVAQGAIAMAAVCYGIATLSVRKVTHVPWRIMASAILTLSVILIVPVSFIIDDPLAIDPSWQSLAATVALGLVQTAMATILMYSIVRHQGATFFSQINFLVPLFGVFFGFAFLGEIPALTSLLALAIILCGILLARIGIVKSRNSAS